MKKLTIYLMLLLAIPVVVHTQPVPPPYKGGDGGGAFFASSSVLPLYGTIYVGGNGGGTSSAQSAALNLNLTALIEGLYDGINMVSDVVTVELRNNTSFALVESKTVTLNTSGVGSAVFTAAKNSTPYWIVVKYDNGIETWSSSAVSFSGSYLSYDFTTAKTQAYGGNMTIVGSKWCIYTGDINQDGTVDLNDLIPVLTDYDAADYHAINDLNGDGVVDLNDAVFVLNGYDNGIGIVKPFKSGTFNAKKTIDVTGNKTLIDKINNLRKTIQDAKNRINK